MNTWAIAGSMTTEALHKKILAIPGVVASRDIPIFNGSLTEFGRLFDEPFIVYPDGFYIKVGADV